MNLDASSPDVQAIRVRRSGDTYIASWGRVRSSCTMSGEIAAQRVAAKMFGEGKFDLKQMTGVASIYLVREKA